MKRARSSAEPFVEPKTKRLSLAAAVRKTVNMITRAICDGDIALTNQLLLQNPEQLDPLLVGSYGDTPLTLAVREGKEEMVKSLLRLRCNPNAADHGDECTPLIIAIGKRNHAIITELLRPEFRTNLNQLTVLGDTPLALSLFGGDFKVFQRLVQAGADVNGKLYDDRTLLMRAIEKKDAPRYVSVLLEAGALLETKSPWNNETALSMAFSKGDLASAALLLEAAANVNATDKAGRNILLRAVHCAQALSLPQNLPLIRLLLWHGADARMPSYWRGDCSASDYVNENDLFGTASLFFVFEEATSTLAKAALLFREDDVASIMRTKYNSLGREGLFSPKDAELCRPTAEHMILRIARSLQTEHFGAAITALGLHSVFARGVLRVTLDYVGCEWDGDVVASTEEEIELA